jgi:hypothetical protein
MSKTHIVSPEDYLGFKVGEEKKLADWLQIVYYFKGLAFASDRVKVDVLGETTEQNPFLRAIITSPENHATLETIRQKQMKICNPKDVTPLEAKLLVSEGKTVVLITCSIHSTEIAASQMALKLAYKLASEETTEVQEILENVILLLVPSLNPDGHEIVVKWYKETLGTKAEGTRPPWMYHKYVGHDNNRDWFMFTQKETQLAVEKIHNRWHPHIVYDLHQMGQMGPRLYLPPFIDPFEPNIDPVLLSGIAFMGTSMANELIGEQKSGVVVHWVYDAWTPARAYQHYHNGIRILSEAASVDIASPIKVKKGELVAKRGLDPREVRWNNPLPWLGGEWRLKDIVEYELSAALACLRNAARYRDRWLSNALQIGKNALQPNKGPYAYIIPLEQKDPATTVELLNTLIKGDVQIHTAKEDFEAAGIQYPVGTYIILFAQPYGRFAKTMLEVQKYPELRERPDEPPKRPYDVTAHTLGLMMDVEVHEIDEVFEVELEKVETASVGEGLILGGDKKPFYIFTPEMNVSSEAANLLLDRGIDVYRVHRSILYGTERIPPGGFLVKGDAKTVETLRFLAVEYGVNFFGVETKPEELSKLRTSRIGIYKAWISNADEGWMRFVLETFGFHFKSLSPQDIRQGKLAEKFDIVIFPDLTRDIIVEGISGSPRFTPEYVKKYPLKYRIGIGKQGVNELLKFLKEGGTIIAINDSCVMPIQDLWAPVENVLEGLNEEDFYIPGSILRVLIDNHHPVGYGFNREAAIFFRRSPAFDIKDGISVAKYPLANPLLSGWILGEKHLHNRTALTEITAGRGRIILFGFSPYFRSQTHGTFKLLFNSIFYATN